MKSSKHFREYKTKAYNVTLPPSSQIAQTAKESSSLLTSLLPSSSSQSTEKLGFFVV